MNSGTVRQANLEDVPEVVALASSIPEAPGWTESMYGDYVRSPGEALCSKALFVAQEDGHLSGFAAATAVAGRAELESIAVVQTARRAGVGSTLLSALCAWAQEQGGAYLELEVRAANQRAQAFYAAHGFHVEGRRARYYKDPEDDALLMRLDLAGQ